MLEPPPPVDIRDHAAVAEIYSNNLTQRCTQLTDDINRIYKKVREGELFHCRAGNCSTYIFWVGKLVLYLVIMGVQLVKWVLRNWVIG